MEEFLTSIEGYIAYIAPAVTEILTCLLTIFYALSKVKSIANNAVNETKVLKSKLIANEKANAELAQANKSLESRLEEILKTNKEFIEKGVIENEKVQALVRTLENAKQTQEALTNEITTIKQQLAVALKENSNGTK